jgi:alcohol dehydrogenase (cytochrome c)
MISMISIAAAALAQGLDPELLTKPATDSWPTYSGDYSGRRFSSLTQINQTNIKIWGLPG